MHRAAHQRIVSRPATSIAPPTYKDGDTTVLETLDAEPLSIAPESFAKTPSDLAAPLERRQQLAIVIRQRIESRLPGRVRNLAIRVFDDTVLLEGQCATYYTKQIAQHAAMGVLENEHLENAIVVAVVQR